MAPRVPRVPRGAAASELRAVSCTGPSACLAIGDTGAGGAGSGKLFAERWNGSTWRMVPIADPGRAVIPAMSCTSAKSCFAAGYRSSDKAITERWNGQKWSLVTPRRPRPDSQLLGVSCPGKRDCFAIDLRRPIGARSSSCVSWSRASSSVRTTGSSTAAM